LYLHLHLPQKAYPSTLGIFGTGSAKNNNNIKENIDNVTQGHPTGKFEQKYLKYHFLLLRLFQSFLKTYLIF